MPIPKPTKGEKQNDFVSRCIGQLKREDPNMPSNQAAAICNQTFRDRNKQKNSTNWQRLNFNVPITESALIDGNFLIKGVAINSTVTRNGVKYVEDELSTSAASLRNKPILKDHENSIDAIVGRTTQNVNFDNINKNVIFEAKIMDKDIQDKIDDGRIQSVSVGAVVNKLEEQESSDGEEHFVIARGIEFVELSLVAVPADPNAGIANALMESFNLKKQQESLVDNTMEEDKMTEQETVVEKPQAKVEEAPKDEVMSKVADTMEAVSKNLVNISERLAKLEEAKETTEEKSDNGETAAEPAKATEEEVIDETQGEVGTADQTEELTNGLVFEKSEGKGYSWYQASYDGTKYKKLSRSSE